MALSVGISTGTRIRVGDHCVEVKASLPPNRIVIDVDNGGEIIVSDQVATTILPGVKVFSGIGKNGKGARLAFEAPREISIIRLKKLAGGPHLSGWGRQK